MVSILEWLKKLFFGEKRPAEKPTKKKRSIKKRIKERIKERKRKLAKLARVRAKRKKKQIRITIKRVPRPRRVVRIKIKQPKIKHELTKPVIAKKEKKPEVHKLPKEITREIIVSDIMVKNVYKVRTGDTLSFVVRLFAEKGISGAPVMHDTTFVGMISETDVLKVIGAKDLLSIGGLGLKRLGEIKVEQVMNRNPVTVNEYTTLSHATDLMNKYDVMRLPVLDERRNVVGILTRTDIIRGISKEILFRLLQKKPEEIKKLRLRIETDIDEILRIVDRRGLIGIDEIQKKLNIPQDKIEEWGKVLEKHDLVEVFYPPIGKPELRKKPK